MNAVVERERMILRDLLEPITTLTVSESADMYRMIAPGTSPEPGPWVTDRVPYARGIMDAFNDPEVEDVVAMTAAQVAKTEILNNVAFHFAKHDPAPMLIVFPSQQAGEYWSENRFGPAIQASPEIREVFMDVSKKRHKRFTGGYVVITGANSAAELASHPIRIALGDEVDRWPMSAQDEGSPVALVRTRTANFWNRKRGWFSTPTLAEFSKIEEMFLEGDQRYYFVPCPHCDHMQTLRWGGRDTAFGLKWERDEDGDPIPETAAYLCESCGALIPETRKYDMLLAGEWRATAETLSRTRSFHLNALYSPFAKWSEQVEKWVRAQDNRFELQAFVNTVLGETWEDEGAVVSTDPLMARREDYPADPVPDQVLVITAGIDIQADRAEVEFVGFGLEDETWSLDVLYITGDPTTPQLWRDIETNVLRRTFTHPTGYTLHVSATAIDSGYQAQQVMRFTKDRVAMRAWAIKGVAGEGKPIMGRPHTRTKGRVPLYPVGVDTAKATLYSRLTVEEPGPGYCHFPNRPPYDRAYFDELTSEKMMIKQDQRGYPKRQWVRRPNRRAEKLDCRVYAMAAFEGLLAGGMRLEQIAEDLRQGDDEVEERDDTEATDWATRGGRWGK